MGEYKGQPDYVVAGFLCGVLENWKNALPNDEWGEYVMVLIEAADRCLSVSDEDKTHVLIGWVMDEIGAAFNNGTWNDYEDEIYTKATMEAQKALPSVIEYWRKQAPGFKGEDALEEMIAKLPMWVMPPSDEADRQFRLALLEDRKTQLVQELADISEKIEELDGHAEADR